MKTPLRAPARGFIAAFALIVLAALVFDLPSRGQLQQSGGPGSSINVNQVGGTSTATGNGATNAGTQRVTISSDSTGQLTLAAGSAAIGSITNSGFNVTGSLPAGTNLIGYTRPANACGTTSYESGMQYLPSASTSLTATATCVSVLVLNNTSSSPVTVSIQDQSTACNSAACNVLSSFSIPGNSQMDIPLFGAKFTGGIKWSAGSATTVVADVIGNQ